MSEQEHSFPTDGPIEAEIHVAAGRVELTAGPGSTVEVTIDPADDAKGSLEAARETTVEFADGRLEVRERGPKLRRHALLVTVTLPQDSALRIHAASADVRCRGRLAELLGKTASGDLRVEEVTGSVEFHGASGGLEVETVGGAVSAKCASGDVRIGRAASVSVSTASGDTWVGAAGDVDLSSASGDLEVRALSGPLHAKVASGDIRIGLAAGVSARLDVSTASGQVRSELPVEDQPEGTGTPVEVRARTASGDITISRATVSA